MERAVDTVWSSRRNGSSPSRMLGALYDVRAEVPVTRAIFRDL